MILFWNLADVMEGIDLLGVLGVVLLREEFGSGLNIMKEKQFLNLNVKNVEMK